MDSKEILEQLKELKKGNPDLKYHHKNKTEVLQKVYDDEIERLRVELNKGENKVLLSEPIDLKADLGEKEFERLTPEEAITEHPKITHITADVGFSVSAIEDKITEEKPKYTIAQFKIMFQALREYGKGLHKQESTHRTAIINNISHRKLGLFWREKLKNL